MESVLYICDYCGKEFELTKYQKKNKNKKHYCSGKCQCLSSPRPKRTHSQCGTRLYIIWGNMKQRCENKKNGSYQSYGGRGISICSDWKNFINFKDWAIDNGYSEELTLDRKNNDLGYNPENCKWSTRIEQCNNRRTSKFIIYKGKSQTLSQWAKELNISVVTLRRRLIRNLPEEKIFFNGLLTKHGVSVNHNKVNRLDNIWYSIKIRTLSKNSAAFQDYGGRGINVCEDWVKNKQNFITWALENGYKDNLTLDRKNNDGPYSPDNCRWSTTLEQNRNKRNNLILSYKGEYHCLAEWSEILGISSFALKRRLSTHKGNDDKIFHVGKLKINEITNQ